MATHIRCYDCGDFFSIKEHVCPGCEAPRRTRNGYLEKIKLNNHLYAQAEKADNDRKSGKPEPWAYAQAAQIMERM